MKCEASSMEVKNFNEVILASWLLPTKRMKPNGLAKRWPIIDPSKKKER